ncbi:alpha/beta hydrolase [Kaistella sp. DKR-2]|uniref:alpha/beta fold hydrolase n=1 Tax=Kaistella soli TaxID=2849654 RepID=UPI001C2785F9|nr:alpha/beta hydrolase [Kaistella soli]MBU8881517.1 alpha/beta hydrolase [Kaistella soli]
MNKIYIFSGLGVDKRVFDKIDFGNLDVEFVDWITPQKKESIENYARRIQENIKTENPILIGLSFGGMVSVEISKIRKTQKIILLASAKIKSELPLMYRISGICNLHKMIPNSVFKFHTFITNWMFGARSAEEKKLLRNIIKDTDPDFLSWAVNEIVNWENQITPENALHIHGDRDKVIPLRNVKADHIIKNGGHFMTVSHSAEIGVMIRNILNNSTKQI